MSKHYFKKALSSALLLGLPLTITGMAFAANPVNLREQPINTLQSLMTVSTMVNGVSANGVVETSRLVDTNNTLHVRVQQMYGNYPVWGADAIVHVPNGSNVAKSLSSVLTAANAQRGSMDGTVYQNLQTDLAKAPAVVFSDAQAQKAIQAVVAGYQKTAGLSAAVTAQKAKLIVFIGDDNKANWAYQVAFDVAPAKAGMLPAKPVYIVDALNFTTYANWDNIKTVGDNGNNGNNGSTIPTEEKPGGGFGGNIKMGKLVYDGLAGDLHYAKLTVSRATDNSNLCLLSNHDVVVKSAKDSKVISFPCEAPNAEHDGVYWDADLDAVNDGYSPGNDALFGGAVIQDMYKQWYGVPALKDDEGKPMMLTMVVHEYMDNAYWDGQKMTFGDGISMFYPLTSLGVAAHEISHGFTEQHSNLAYYRQSGGMNEAFSDMAAQAAEFFAYGKNSWQIGPEIFKQEGRALRYMDKPSKDGRSIDTAKKYKDGLDVHYSSGVYNRAFYLMGTANGWDTRKAFDVMVKANEVYWTSSVTFKDGACGVMKAAKDLNYDTDTVAKAFKKVGIKTSKCLA